MNPELADYRRGSGHPLAGALFLSSGATSLVYETIWERQLHLIFGTSQVAVSTVLAAFMTGLALGGFGGAKWGDQSKADSGICGTRNCSSAHMPRFSGIG